MYIWSSLLFLKPCLEPIGSGIIRPALCSRIRMSSGMHRNLLNYLDFAFLKVTGESLTIGMSIIRAWVVRLISYFIMEYERRFLKFPRLNWTSHNIKDSWLMKPIMFVWKRSNKLTEIETFPVNSFSSLENGTKKHLHIFHFHFLKQNWIIWKCSCTPLLRYLPWNNF